MRGVGSYFRGIYRCAKYCGVDSIKTQAEIAQTYAADEGFRKCVNVAALDYLSDTDNQLYMSGRVGTGIGISSLLVNRMGGGGAVIGGSMAFTAIQGDVSYGISQGGSAAQALSSALTGEPNALSEELICMCLDYYGGDT